MTTNAAQQVNPLGQAPLKRLMLKFSIPSVITLIVMYLYNIVDQIFIGHGIGYLGNAATNVIFPITVFAMAISMLFADGGAAFMNLNLGKGKKREASATIGNVVISSLVSSLVLTVLCLIFLEPLCKMLGATEASLQHSLDYGHIVILAFPFINFAGSVCALIRADGNPRYSMIVMLSGAIINTVLDPIFIFGFEWGMKGAGLATVISQFVSAALCVHYIVKSRFKHVDCSVANFRINAKVLSRICVLGISSFVAQLMLVLVIAATNNALTFYGARSVYGAEIPLAALGITMKVNQIIMGICIGIAAGCAPIISFNYGAAQIKRVKKTILYALSVTGCVTLAATFCFHFFPQYIIRIFGLESEIYEQFAIKTFRIFLLLMTFNGFQICASIFFQALGKPLESLLIQVSRQVIFFIPAMLLLCSVMGVEGVLWAGPVGDFLTFCLAFPLVLRLFREFKIMELKTKS